ncbi:MAG TPA: cell division protein CrgA [Mycobacteriales bacterium]|nr:cell division protein CrgA [Mycobacteriales bacterium]
MPKSRVRKKKVYTPPTQTISGGTTSAKKRRPSSAWLPGTALGLAVLGMVWLVVYYLSKGSLPIADAAKLNIGVGFGCIVASLFLFTRWR